MRSSWPTIALAALMSVYTGSAHALDPPAGWKAKELPAAEEKRWIEAVKNHQTADGATVAQVVAYAEKLRPTKFKLVGYEVLYSGEGEPDTVSVQYWLGAQRLEGDTYSDMSYQVRRDGDRIVLSNDTNDKFYRFSSVYALEQGRVRFLSYIDERYQTYCIDAATGEKSC